MLSTMAVNEKRFFEILLVAHTYGSFVDGWVFLKVMELTRTDKGQARS